MASSATCETFGRGAAYVGYNVPGVSFLGGFVRVVMSIYHLAKKYFSTESPSTVSISSEGWRGKLAKCFNYGVDQLNSGGKGVRKEAWKSELRRGLIEMIPIAGPAYLTYQDYKNDRSIYGLSEMAELVNESWDD